MIRDITKKKLAEKSLKASQEYAKSVIDSSLYMIIAVDKDRKIIEFNKAAEKTFGYRPEEILGKHIDILYVNPQEGLTINNVTHEKGRFTGEILNRRKNGETFPSFLDSSVLRNARGEQVGVMGISRDISERKQAEKALKFTQFAIDRTGEAAYWMDSQAHFFYVNGTACRSLGYSREELLSMTVHDVDPGFPAETWPRAWEEVKKRRCFSFESHHRTKHGRIFPVEITVNYMEFEGKEYNCAFARDITKRKQAEEERARLFEETKRNLEHISALHSVTAAASESLRLDSILQEVIKKITEVFHFDATRIFLFDPPASKLHLRASFETQPEFFAGARVFRRGQGLVGRVADTGEALLFEDVLSDPRYQELSHSKLSQKGKFSFFAGVPVKVKKSLIGVLVCIGKDARRLTPDERRLIKSMADQIAVAVDNATLFQETVSRARELSAFNSISTIVNKSLDLDSTLSNIMYGIMEIFHFNAARIYLFDEDKKELRLKAHEGFPKDINPLSSYKPGQGILGKVFEAGEPVLFDDIQNSPEFYRQAYSKTLLEGGFRSHFSIPIGIRGRTIGVMNFVTKEPHHFSRGETQLIHSITNHLGIAIENARLYEHTKKQALQLEKDVIERKQAEEQAQRQMQRLTILGEITKAINSTLDLRTILNVLLEKIDLLLPYSVTTLRLINKETGLLEAVAARNVDEKEWKTTMREGGRGFSKGVLKNKGPVIIANVQKSTHIQYPEFLRKYGLISYLGVPLIVKDNILGTLGFYTKEDHEFSKEEVEFLSTLAGQAAIAIDNAQLFEQVEKRSHELSALQAVTASSSQSLELDVVLQEVIKKITEIFHFDATRIFLFNPQMDELHLQASYETDPKFFAGVRVFRRGQGNVGRVFETGEALVFEDIQSDPRYGKSSHTKNTQKAGFSFFAAFPIKSKQTTIGTIVCIGKDPRRLNLDEIQLITSMAGQIGIAVENANLFEEIEGKAKELSALYSIATAVNQSLDLNLLLRSVMEKVLEIFDFDAARIYLFDEETKELRLLAHQGFPQDAIPPDSYKPGQGILGKVFERGEPILFEDIQTDPEFHRLVDKGVALRAGFRGSFGIPIRMKYKAVGVINFVSKSVHRFPSNEVQLIHSIFNQIAVAIVNAKLYEETKKQALQLEKDVIERKRAEKELKQANAELAKHEMALRYTLSDLRKSHEELKAAQSQLIQAGKLESVGRLAAGVAHEVKNPLAIILQGTHYLSKHLPTNGDNVAIAVQEVNNAVKRADSVVRGLLDFSAPSELSLTAEELNSVVEQSLSMVRHELAKNCVKAVRELSEDLPPVRLDRNKMEQVFVNIFLNAVHAMPEGGTLTIKTYTKRLTKVAHNGGSRKADHFRIGQTVVMAKVEDTGTGIPKDKLSEVFDPFFTTKSTGKGTGLGLAVTKKIIDLHGGTINIGNRKEGGARVTIMFKARGGKDHEEETDPAH